METVQMFFRSAHVKSRQEAEDRLQSYLASLFQNGQIVGDSPTARVRGGYLVVVNIPRADALAHRHANRWVRQAEKRLVAGGLRTPKVRALGHEPDSLAPCACRRRPYLVLFTTLLSDESPVRCGRCFGPIPLYALPATDEVGSRRDLLAWQSTFQAMDSLFIGGGAGERFAHRQMSDVASALSQEGRKLARLLELKTGRPVYYYLMKHFGSNDAQERRRTCPSCGRGWALSTSLHSIFDFRCHRCRLLSNVAFDVRLALPHR